MYTGLGHGMWRDHLTTVPLNPWPWPHQWPWGQRVLQAVPCTLPLGPSYVHRWTLTSKTPLLLTLFTSVTQSGAVFLALNCLCGSCERLEKRSQTRGPPFHSGFPPKQALSKDLNVSCSFEGWSWETLVGKVGRCVGRKAAHPWCIISQISPVDKSLPLLEHEL